MSTLLGDKQLVFKSYYFNQINSSRLKSLSTKEILLNPQNYSFVS